ncbi:MAG: hypothetical protein ABIO70_10795 [Pseudomonadota bacterium]
MTPRLPALLALVAATGCVPAIDGVWQFSLDVATVLDPTCSENISHNFTDARVVGEEEEDGAWTEGGEQVESDEVFFGLITSTGADAATLVVGDQAFPGLREAEGAWTFAWTWFSSSSDLAEHEEGYTWAASADASRERTFTLTADGDVLSGTRGDLTTATWSWTESDAWSGEELAPYLGGDGMGGQIPAASYLEVDDWESGTTVAASNRADMFDCEDSECVINRLWTCTEIHAIDAVRTALPEGEGFDDVAGAGQEAGY